MATVLAMGDPFVLRKKNGVAICCLLSKLGRERCLDLDDDRVPY